MVHVKAIEMAQLGLAIKKMSVAAERKLCLWARLMLTEIGWQLGEILSMSAESRSID